MHTLARASVAAGALLALSAASLVAQQPAAAVTHPTPVPDSAARPAARPADVVSVDSILAALYDVISAPAGQQRDWDRMRSLFLPGARLIPTGPMQNSPNQTARVWTVDEYITRAGPGLERMGFFEMEIARRTDSWGNLAHAFSTYEARRAASDPEPFMRGINSIQLFNDGVRWWVVSIFWEQESPARPIPANYLPTR